MDVGYLWYYDIVTRTSLDVFSGSLRHPRLPHDMKLFCELDWNPYSHGGETDSFEMTKSSVTI